MVTAQAEVQLGAGDENGGRVLGVWSMALSGSLPLFRPDRRPETGNQPCGVNLLRAVMLDECCVSGSTTDRFPLRGQHPAAGRGSIGWQRPDNLLK
jgi:hypothetical protein